MSLKDLYTNSSGYTPTPSNTSAPTTTKKSSSGLSALLENSMSEEVKAPTTTPKVQPTPATTEKKSLFKKVVSLPGKAIQKAGEKLADTKFMREVGAGLALSPEDSMAERVLKTPASLVGGASPENLPLGVGEVVKQSKEFLRDEQTPNVTFSDWLTGMKKAGQGFASQVVSGVTEFPNILTAGKYQPQIKFNIPGLGEVTNSDFRIAQRIEAGESPEVVVAEEKAGGFLNALFIVGIMAKPFLARQVSIGKVKTGEVPTTQGVVTAPKAKSFQRYTAPKYTQPMPPEYVQRVIAEKGLTLPKSFDPKMPTYFKMTGTPSGKINAELVQIKPSYYRTFVDKLKSNFENVPDTATTKLLTTSTDIKQIQSAKPQSPIVPKTPRAIETTPRTPVVPETPKTPSVVEPVAPVQPNNLMKLAQEAGVPVETPTPQTPQVPVSSPQLPQSEQVTPPAVQNVPNVNSNQVPVETPATTPARSSKRIGLMDYHPTYTERMNQLIKEAQDNGDLFPYTKMTPQEQKIVDNALNETLSGIKKNSENRREIVKENVAPEKPPRIYQGEAPRSQTPIYKKGDIVVDDDGRRLEITSGNDKTYDSEAVRSMNEGYVRARIVGEKDDFIWYTNRISKKIEAPKKQLFTQKAKVADTLKEQPKSIKEIAQETNIKEPNVRRILGVGAKEGTFARVDKGVYKLTVNGEDLAYIETGNALEVLPRLAKEGFKSDMIFLDIPYKTSAIKGGNRGMNYNLITVDEFGKVLDSIKEIARTPDAPVIHMFSQAPSGMREMQKYNDLFVEKGFVPVGKGELQKTFKDGKPVTNVRGEVSKPEGIIVFTQSGKLQKDLKNLNFKLVRPKGYQSEKPAEMLKEMIEMTTNEGDVVLDPFAGSGVTGAEAVKSGRKAYLIEKDVDVAEKVTKPRVELALKPSKADTLEKSQKERIALGEDERTVKVGNLKTIPTPLFRKTDAKTLLQSSSEFKQNPVLTVAEIDGKKFLTFKGEKQQFKIKADAIGLREENLKVGSEIRVDLKDLSEKGAGQQLRVFRGENVEASLADELSEGKIAPATSPDELMKRIEQLNKFGQSRAILRRTGGLTKKQAGIFRAKTDPKDRGVVHLQDYIVKNPQQYMSVLAHELGHAMEKSLTGSTNKDTYKVFGRDLSPEIKKTIREELKAVTNDLEGEAKAKAGAGYYYKDTELLARFLQKHFESPGNLTELAPTAVEYFERSAIENPIVAEYLEAVRGSIDQGQRNTIMLRDMKETFQKKLGKRAGEKAWNDIVRYRAMKERAKLEVEKLIKTKFKNVKDDPALLFQTAEAITTTKGGVPQFGTRDFQYAKNDSELTRLMLVGYEPLEMNGKPIVEFINGEEYLRLAKQRYTPEQGKAMYDSLSPEGKQLINDFTAVKEEAKDYFNREMIKDVNKINSNIEGWVHHYFDDKGTGIGGDKLKLKRASATKQRTGSEGYVKDLQKSLQKALTEIETAKAYNNFVDEFFSRVTEPIAKGEKPKPGYVEVVGDIKKGVGTPFENRTTIIQDGKGIPAQKPRYQMPEEIYRKYKLVSELATEASTATKLMNSVNRYWRVNILFHPGSSATNFISGGIQYGTKVLTDFYTELLTGNLKMDKTRRNVSAMLKVLTPKGWEEAPDWSYGGDLSNYYGEFMSEKSPGFDKLNRSIDAYADKTLKFYGAVERYWKKVIATAENVGDLKNLGKMTKEGLRLPTDEEKQLLDDINSEIDLFAYDYDNVPLWLEAWSRNPAGQAVKPFVTYLYKYTKHVNELATAVFDRTQPKQERIAKLLALSTIVALYAYIRSKRKEEQETPEVPETAPASVSTRGRLFVGTDSEGKEMFTRTAKYPFVNLTETGAQFLEGNTNTAFQSINDMIGSVAPVGKIGLALLGYRNEFEQYTPYPVILGKDLSSFVPGTRILQDLGRLFDPFQRKPTTFLQGFTSLIPLPSASEDLRAKLRGDIRTIRVPLEGEIKPNAGEGTKRTTTDMYVRNYKTDILMGLLGGIYINRIDPEVGKAFIIRQAENEEKEVKKAEKEAKTDAEGKPVSILKKAGSLAVEGAKSLFLPKTASAQEMPAKPKAEEVGLISVPPRWSYAMEDVYMRYPDVPKGFVETVLLMESSMGKDASLKKKDFGEYGYLGGHTHTGAFKDLLKKAEKDPKLEAKIKVLEKKDGKYAITNIKNLGDEYSAIQATGSVIASLARNNPGLDPVDLYFKRYVTAPQSDTPARRAKFKKAFEYYSK